MTPIAYVFEADTHCPDCTEARFPDCTGEDNEGNEVGAVWSWDEFDTPLVCGSCGERVDE